MSNILLINDNVQDYQTIIDACKDNTYAITYNQGTDTYDSIFKKYENIVLKNNIQLVNHLALVSHGSINPEFTFLEKENKMLISQYLPDISNCASCQTNETEYNDLSLNNIDELFDNTPDIHKCIVDLSLNITQEEFDTKETYTYEEIISIFKDVSNNVFDIVALFSDISGGDESYPMPYVHELIQEFCYTIPNTSHDETFDISTTDLYLNTPDIHKYIVDLSLNITPNEFVTNETYTSEEIISIFKDASCNVFDLLRPFTYVSDNTAHPMPVIYTLIEDVYYYNIISSPENEDALTESSINEFNGYIINTLDTWSTFKEFIKKFNIQTSLDFLGCALLQSSDWKYTLETLETEQHIHLNIRASDDDTGNLKVGADWVLETDNVNIKELYFDGESIEKWYYTLNTNIPSVNIKFSDLQTLYNTVNSPASITNPFSLGKFKGCEFVQPITYITLDSNYEQTFTSSGTFTFTVPAGVTEFSAVCVGGGGGGSASTSSSNGYAGGGGGGGALHWRTLTVSPGTVFNINVGAGGSPGSSAGINNAQNGGETSIKIGGTYYLRAGGGNKGNYNSNSQSNGGTTDYGTYGGGGGNGGNGGGGQSGNTSGGGGGAGGYSGNGGNGSTGTQYNETAGQGGGGGGGTGHNGWTLPGIFGGGGVGILIGEGTSGGANLSTSNRQGIPGSGGSNKNYGGGGAGSEDDSGAAGASGGPGAVRIIWGGAPGTRAYPSTLVASGSTGILFLDPDPPVPLTNISIGTFFKGSTFINMVPSMTITSVGGQGGYNINNGGKSNDTFITLYFTSSQPTSDFVESDITTTSGTISLFSSTSPTSPTTYEARFTPTSLVDMTDHTITVSQGAYTNNKTTIGCQNIAAQFVWTYSLISFSGMTFNNCNQTGRSGPSLFTCNNYYTSNYNADYGQLVNFVVTYGYQSFDIPPGSYIVTMDGACGGSTSNSAISGWNAFPSTSLRHARGARATFTLSITTMTTLTMVCGQAGGNNDSTRHNSGGGGGTFLVAGTYSQVSANTATDELICAVGGGGGYNGPQGGQNNYNGGEGQSDPINSNNNSGTNGSAGNGAKAATNANNSGGGAGYISNAGGSTDNLFGGNAIGRYGWGFRNGSVGHQNSSTDYNSRGGFGGGGGGSAQSSRDEDKGGGGGYSGGGYAFDAYNFGNGGGSIVVAGGGSSLWNTSNASITRGGGQTLHGQIIFAR